MLYCVAAAGVNAKHNVAVPICSTVLLTSFLIYALCKYMRARNLPNIIGVAHDVGFSARYIW